VTAGRHQRIRLKLPQMRRLTRPIRKRKAAASKVGTPSREILRAGERPPQMAHRKMTNRTVPGLSLSAEKG